MINDILIALTAMIKAAYPEQEVYIDTVEQGLEEPCFFIRCIDVSQRDGLVGQSEGIYRRSQPFEILYFPDADQPTHELYNVAENLIMGLRHLDGRNGTDLSYRIDEDVLQMLVNYDVSIRRTESDPELMEKLYYSGGIND